MNVDRAGKSQQFALVNERRSSHKFVDRRCCGKAKLMSGTIRDLLLLAEAAFPLRLIAIEIGIDRRAYPPVTLQHVLNFVPQHKPEIVDPVISKRQTNDWRRFIQP